MTMYLKAATCSGATNGAKYGIYSGHQRHGVPKKKNLTGDGTPKYGLFWGYIYFGYT
jgi:hypothetical protein